MEDQQTTIKNKLIIKFSLVKTKGAVSIRLIKGDLSDPKVKPWVLVEIETTEQSKPKPIATVTAVQGTQLSRPIMFMQPLVISNSYYATDGIDWFDVVRTNRGRIADRRKPIRDNHLIKQVLDRLVKVYTQSLVDTNIQNKFAVLEHEDGVYSNVINLPPD